MHSHTHVNSICVEQQGQYKDHVTLSIHQDPSLLLFSVHVVSFLRFFLKRKKQQTRRRLESMHQEEELRRGQHKHLVRGS